MSSCKQMRCALVKTYNLNMETGERKLIGEEWKVQPCNVPLFNKIQKMCRGCAEGWSVPNNYPCP